MDMLEAAAKLAGVARTEGRAASHPTNAHLVTAEPQADSESGRVLVDFGGDTFTVDGSQYVEVETIGEVSADGGDVVVLLTGSDGGGKQPLVIGQPGAGDRQGRLIAAVQAVADAINQHFWHDENGAHVTQATQDEWEQEQSGPNSLWNSLGMLFRDGLNNLLTITTQDGARELAIWDGLGNDEGNVLATFGADETHIGYSDGISAVYLANDKNQFKGYTRDSHSQVSGSAVRQTFGTLLSEAVWDGPKESSDWDPEEDSSFVSRAGLDTYSNVSTNHDYASRTRVSLLASTMAWWGASPDASGTGGSDPLNPYINQSDQLTASITLESDLFSNKRKVDVSADILSLPGIADLDMVEVAATLRNPIATYTGTASTSTATIQGWRLTYFNVVKAEHGYPTDYDYTFSNGVLTALRDCMLEVSGVMRWKDTVTGQLGFGVFEGELVTSSPEHSVFQTWNQTQNQNKSVVFPPQLFSLRAGDILTFARYENPGNVYTNGQNYSWVTIRVVG